MQSNIVETRGATLLEFPLMLKMNWSVLLAAVACFGSACGRGRQQSVTETAIVGYGQMELPAPASVVGEMLQVARATIHQTVALLLLCALFGREWVQFSITLITIIDGKTQALHCLILLFVSEVIEK